MNNTKEIKLSFFDFDGCMANTPLPDTGKDIWAKHHNKPYPHQGWWGRIESMCLDAFNIETHAHVHSEWKRLHDAGYISKIHTSRRPLFKDSIQKILDKNGVEVTDILTVMGNITKGERIVSEIEEWQKQGYKVTHVVFYDDRQKEIVTVEAVRPQIENLGIELTVVKVQSDAMD